MSNQRLRIIAAAALVIGALLGMAGSFAPTAELRALAWGIDGIALVAGSALLVVHHVRRGNELLAAAFLVFLAGETLIVSASAMGLTASSSVIAAGFGLWSAALALAGMSPAVPLFVRATGGIAATMLGVCSVQILGGAALTPLSKPLPFFAFPFLAMTLVGWAWMHCSTAPAALKFPRLSSLLPSRSRASENRVRSFRPDARSRSGGAIAND
jgi:hypothetical protein